ncbi:MAG: PEGA domain-containing protein [Betaproteobacteria bacterium]|nr:MAG: PEGA domain-containing protein [Betaproteobacteria bacterium]
MLLEQIGRYEILVELGHGAMGIVYKARDPLLDRTVALKTVDLDVSGEDSEAFERRFYREARSAGRLNHSNIVTIHDVGKSDSIAYIAMEFLQGQSLREILDSGVVLPPERVVDIIAQVADGLAFAHEHNVVHRDVKPANIMVLDSGRVKITDFGIALLPMGSRTSAGTVFGSPKYMSPEQIVGRGVDGRADVFSLGAVLYEMLTGFAPFFGGDLDAVLFRVVNEMPAAPSSRDKSIAPVFDYIVARAMAKDPDDRYPSARAMAADLRNFRDWQPASTLRHEAQTTERPVIRLRKGAVPSPNEAAPASPDAIAAHVAGAVDAASFGSRRRLLLLGVPAALLVVAGGALLARRAPRRTPPATGPLVGDAPRAELLAVGDLRAAKPAAVVPVAEPAPEARVDRSSGSAPPQSRAPGRSVAAAGKPTARLTLAVAPWGEVYVDGRKRGISPPLTEVRLAPGKHDIEIRNTTFPRYVQSVNLKPDAQLKVKHKFQ